MQYILYLLCVHFIEPIRGDSLGIITTLFACQTQPISAQNTFIITHENLPKPYPMHGAESDPHSLTLLHHLPPSPEEKYGCEVRIIPVDFSDGHEIYPRIAEELQDLDIGILSQLLL